MIKNRRVYFLDFVCSISMLGKLNPSVQAPSFSCHVNATVKSSTSSSTSKSTSSSSNSSSSNSSSSCSEVKKPPARATIVVPSSLSRCHNSQNPPYSRIGTSFDTCCKLSHCELCHERQRSRRAGLMLDVIKTLPKSGRSNKKKFHQILDNILSHT